MIFTIADIIVCGLGIVLCTVFEYCYAVKLERRSALIVKKLMLKKKIIVIYLLVAVVVCVLRLLIEMKLVGSELKWRFYVTCVIQGACCGLYTSMVMLLYWGYRHEEKYRGNKERL